MNRPKQREEALELDHRALINRPKTKKGRETLNRIVSAAAQEFYEKGYHNASINDITRRAGVASGTFYVYFDGKYNLYKFLLLQCSHMIRKHQNQAVQNCASRREAEEVGQREWLKFVRENRYVYHIIWESLYIDKQLFTDYYVDFCHAYMRGIDAAKAAGEIRADIDSEVLAYALMGISHFLGLNWGLFQDYPTNEEMVVESFMRIISSGIFAEPMETAEPVPVDLPISIEVEFDDDDDLEDEGGEEAFVEPSPKK